MNKDFSGFTFSIIKHHNSPNEAVTMDGDKVERQESIWFGDPINHIVRCAPYDTHFVYDDPSRLPGRWSPMCTCGSPAGITGYNAYRNDASPSMGGSVPGEMVVCLAHANTGRHADGVQ